MSGDNNNKWTMAQAIGTWAYFVITVTIFIVMLISMLEMRKSNELTRQNLELEYRPRLYLEEIKRIKTSDSDSARLKFSFKNFGIVAAKDIMVAVTPTKNRKPVIILHKKPREGICPPQEHVYCEEVVSNKELAVGLFAHIFVSYTAVSKVSETQGNYYNLMGIIKMVMTEDQKFYDHLGWDEKLMKGPLPDSVVLYYKEKDLKMKISREDGQIEWL